MERDGQRNPGNSKPGAVVVSDVLIYREGIAAGLTRLGHFSTVAALCPAQLAAALKARLVDVLFVDISHPHSRDCARTARDISAGTYVIGFGMMRLLPESFE